MDTDKTRPVRPGYDDTVPYRRVIMTCDAPPAAGQYGLPPGYRFRFYEAGMEADWVRIHLSVAQFRDEAQGMDVFRREFMPLRALLASRMLFVVDAQGQPAGTAALWQGDLFGGARARIHWVCVGNGHQGRGLAYAMLDRLTALYHALELRGGMYLTSQTGSHRALYIYEQCGFAPYLGPMPAGWDREGQDADSACRRFEEEMRVAWDIARAAMKSRQ